MADARKEGADSPGPEKHVRCSDFSSGDLGFPGHGTLLCACTHITSLTPHSNPLQDGTFINPKLQMRN